MRSALRKLCHVGAQALQPTKVVHGTTASTTPSTTTTATTTTSWAKPRISKRVAKVLRKQALRNGTYGTFDTTTGVGWDAGWDLHVMQNQHSATTHLPRIHPPKQTSRERTREARAKKIETLLEPVDEQIEQYYQRKADRKPPKSFENTFKLAVRKTMKR
jgi:hypothetical protein